MASHFYNDAVFWIETEKIKPNPYQPRREFDEVALNSLADSIRQYGVLQALVVTRKEITKEDGGMAVEYELIAGERRLRASKIAGLVQVPALIRAGEENDLMKLELAIIENIQREDLNSVDRARAFNQLVKDFGFKHQAIADKVGKSREYVSNTLRILSLPEHILKSLAENKISEGHTRPLLMLIDRPLEQDTLHKEIIYKKLNVREAEMIARKIAFERARKKEKMIDPEIIEMEEILQESLGTRVQIEKKLSGGQVHIDFFSNEDILALIDLVKGRIGPKKDVSEVLAQHIDDIAEKVEEEALIPKPPEPEEDPNIYSVENFSI